MYNRLKIICKEHGTTVTTLCTESTGNSANLATWKKGYMRSDYLSKCADILGVTTDYILGRETSTRSENLSFQQKKLLSLFEELDSEQQTKVIGMLELYSFENEKVQKKEA